MRSTHVRVVDWLDRCAQWARELEGLGADPSFFEDTAKKLVVGELHASQALLAKVRSVVHTQARNVAWRTLNDEKWRRSVGHVAVSVRYPVFGGWDLVTVNPNGGQDWMVEVAWRGSGAETQRA